jgi:hypothetical protein
MDRPRPRNSETTLYGIWQSQIGLPRDTITMISKWPNADMAKSGTAQIHNQLRLVRSYETNLMTPTLRPKNTKPPTRQGNYAFRWFTTPTEKFEAEDGDNISTLLLTRRPDLSMWERSKIPETAEEIETRQKLSRRYDLCDQTMVFTTTLLTASDRNDTVNWA